MICPYCQSTLTEIKADYGTGFECRKNYFYLEKDYPICHYTYREYQNDPETRLEHRYLFFPFVIYSYPEIDKSEILLLYKEGDMSHHGMLEIATTACITPDFSNINHLIDKLNLYLTFS
jgi:hypothetical protein